MKDAYTKLMLQQHTSEDAAFYEKLEQVKRMNPILRAAVVAACLCLLIPVTVYAVTNIFNTMQVTKTERPTLDNKPGIGLDIVYEDIEYYPLSDFPQHILELEEPAEVLHDSWADAEAYLGIDLIDNSLLAEEDTRLMAAWGEPGKHCQSLYYVWDGQFAGAKLGTIFQRNGITFGISAIGMTEYAGEYDDIIKTYYYGTSMTYAQYPVREVTISTEEYVTKAGIPVLLVTVTREARDSNRADNLKECSAFFAVNNISYRVGVSGWSIEPSDLVDYANEEEKVIATMLEVLDGFVIE